LSQTHQEKKEPKSIKSEIRKVTTDTTETQRIIRNYYEQLHANEGDNPEEMDKFLKTYNLPKLKQEEIENLDNAIKLH